MSQLCRTAVGRFTLADAINLEALEAIGVERALMPAACALAELPRLVLSDADVAAISYGRSLARQDVPEGQEFAAFDARGRLMAVLRADDAGRLRPHRNFASSS